MEIIVFRLNYEQVNHVLFTFMRLFRVKSGILDRRFGQTTHQLSPFEAFI
ncbi:hypothetical protein GY50_0323 [Dehalococcoides mccartyi GY50]|nr:hypothetical protein GY50_0323 [Dehalococcoides mccartyi GY50]